MRGIENGPVHLVRAAGLAGVVTPVPASEFAEDVLDERLADLAWVGERGVAHETVLNWFADRGPVVPLAPFSLHRDEDAVRRRLDERRDAFAATLRRLEGRREWGVRVRRTERVAEHLEALSPRLRALAAEAAAAPPGRRYLLARRVDAARAEELRSVGGVVAGRVFDALKEPAVDARPLPITVAGAAEAAQPLVLNAVFLVDGAGFVGFQGEVSRLAAEYRPLGFEWEFTGPWPAYHFVEP